MFDLCILIRQTSPCFLLLKVAEDVICSPTGFRVDACLVELDDFRLFCGDLGNEVNDDVLTKAFSKYPSFNMARVIRDKWTGKTRGYGFVSFANASDLAAALKEMNGKYVGNRPIKLRKSTWKNRIDYEALQKPKTQPQKKFKAQKKSILHK